MSFFYLSIMLDDFQCTLLMIVTAVSPFYYVFISCSEPTDIWLIMVVIAGGLALIIIASCVVIAPVAIYRKRKKQRRRTYRPNTCSVSQYTKYIF
mgnify:FL=1